MEGGWRGDVVFSDLGKGLTWKFTVKPTKNRHVATARSIEPEAASFGQWAFIARH